MKNHFILSEKTSISLDDIQQITPPDEGKTAILYFTGGGSLRISEDDYHALIQHGKVNNKYIAFVLLMIVAGLFLSGTMGQEKLLTDFYSLVGMI